MTARFVAVGDLHLEKLDRVLGELDHIGLQLQCLHDASNYALDRGINQLVLLGDIFETPHPEQRTVRRLLEVFHSYPRLEFHLIRGNHDTDHVRANSLELLDFISELRALSHVHLYLSPTRAKWGGVRVCFLSYPYRKPVKSEKPQLVFAHQEIAGALRDNGTVIPAESGQLKIKSKSQDYWIIGHLHRYQQGSRYIYPGTMVQMNFGEPLPKGFLEVRAKNGKDLQVKTKFIKYRPPFRLINLAVKSEKHLSKIKQRETDRYKIVLAPGTKLPLGWRNNYPNVINVVGTKDKGQVQQEMDGQISLATDGMATEVDITRNLDGFLKSRGFNSKQRRFGKSEIQQILAQK